MIVSISKEIKRKTYCKLIIDETIFLIKSNVEKLTKNTFFLNFLLITQINKS